MSLLSGLRALVVGTSLGVFACASTTTPAPPSGDAGLALFDAPDGAAGDRGFTEDRREVVDRVIVSEDIARDAGPCEGARCREAEEIWLGLGFANAARLRDGSYVGWGGDSSPFGATASTDFGNGPRMAPIVDGGRQLALGGYFSCLYDPGTGVRPPSCWGMNSNAAFRADRVGVDTLYRFAVEVPGLSMPIRSMVLGSAPNLCVVLEDSSYWCRGANNEDGMGLGAQVESVPQFTRLPLFEPALRGPEYNCGGRVFGVIRQDGAIILRGTSRNLDLGDGVQSAETRTAVVRNVVGAVRFHLHFGGCARLATGDLACWGDWVSPEGEIRSSARDRPARGAVVVPWMRESTDECVGNAFVCGLFPGGRVRCAGDNSQGQIGIGVRSEAEPPTDVTIPAVVTQLRCGGQHACVLTEGGAVYCWGSNANGSAGQPQSQGVVLQPTQVRWD